MTIQPRGALCVAALALAAAACARNAPVSTGAGPAVAKVAERPVPPNAPQKLEGCYGIRMSPWSTKTLGVFVAPPGPFRLDTIPGTTGDDGALTLHAAPIPVKDAARFGQYQLAAWRPVGDDSLDVAWANETHGLTMRLALAPGDTLRGEAQAWTNITVIGGQVPTSVVTAWRMKCS